MFDLVNARIFSNDDGSYNCFLYSSEGRYEGKFTGGLNEVCDWLKHETSRIKQERDARSQADIESAQDEDDTTAGKETK